MTYQCSDNETAVELKTFDNALELIDAIRGLIDTAISLGASSDGVYVNSEEGFFFNGTAYLVEQTLTDGSLVYNVELTSS